MHQFSYMLPPLLGCLVGYITNSLAVKMLFRPYRSIRILNIHIPFTPGMIPKRQKELSIAMGRMVQGHLLTTEAIQQRLLSQEVRTAVTSEISSSVASAIRDQTICNAAENLTGAAEAVRIKENLAGWISERILAECSRIDFRQLLSGEVKSFLERNLGGLAALFMNERSIDLMTVAAADRVREVFEKEGPHVLSSMVDAQIDEFFSQPLEETLIQGGLSQERLSEFLDKLYHRAVQQNLSRVIAAVDVAAIVEDKVASMNVRELEELVTSIMKRELRSIVNLGGLIGFVLGTASLLF